MHLTPQVQEHKDRYKERRTHVLTSRQRDVAEHIHRQLLPRILGTLANFEKKYGRMGGSAEDRRAEADYIFYRLAAIHGPGYLLQHHWWLTRYIWNRLRSQLVKETRGKVRNVSSEALQELPQEPKPQPWSFLDYLSDLSADAKLVALTVIEAPDEVRDIVMGKGGQPRNWRSTLKQWFRRQGWTKDQIAKAFAEIRQAN